MFLAIRIQHALRIGLVCLLIPVALLFGCGERETRYSFEAQHSKKDNSEFWIFAAREHGQKYYAPPLRTSSDADFIESVNLVFTKIGLMPIKTRVPEKSKITGHRWDRGVFEWTDYPGGTLQLHRRSQSDANHAHYTTIWKIILTK